MIWRVVVAHRVCAPHIQLVSQRNSSTCTRMKLFFTGIMFAEAWWTLKIQLETLRIARSTMQMSVILHAPRGVSLTISHNWPIEHHGTNSEQLPSIMGQRELWGICRIFRYYFSARFRRRRFGSAVSCLLRSIFLDCTEWAYSNSINTLCPQTSHDTPLVVHLQPEVIFYLHDALLAFGVCH